MLKWFFFSVTHKDFNTISLFTFKCSLPNLVHRHIFLHRHAQSLFYQFCVLKGSALFFVCSLRHLVSSEISPTSLASNITLHRKAATSLSPVNSCYLFICSSIHPFIHCRHCAGGWECKCEKVWSCLSESLYGVGRGWEWGVHSTAMRLEVQEEFGGRNPKTDSGA